jgi:SNF2 family DNA or RNA helicase
MTVMLAQGNTMLVLPFDQGLANIIPHAQSLDYQGKRMLVVPNRHFEAKLARNLGHEVPPTILTGYDWAGNKPWDVQRVTAAMMVENTRLYCLNEMGTGKTLAALFAIDYLITQGLARRALIAAPLSTLTPVWETEVRRRLPHRSVVALHGTPDKRRTLMGQGADICVINHHGLALLAKDLQDAEFDVVVLDELAVFRNKQTKLWAAAAAVVRPAKWVWGLTGSPTPMSPTDAWAQVRMLTPDNVPRSMSAFRSMVMTQVSQFRWIARTDATTVVHNVMQPAVRFTRNDIIELPEHSTVEREVKLDPLALEAYRRMHQQLRMQAANGEITAANEGVLHSKLLQIATGWVYTNDQKVYELPSKGRLDALVEVVSESSNKVIVFVPFVHAIKGVAAYLTKEGFDVAMVHGGVSRTERDKIFGGFQHGPAPRVIVAHPRTMAHGLTLTAADTIVWYGAITDLEIYEQANARITRPGQKNKTLIVHLHGGLTVEKQAYRRLRERGKMQGLLLDLFADQNVTF